MGAARRAVIAAKQRAARRVVTRAKIEVALGAEKRVAHAAVIRAVIRARSH